MKLQKLNVAVIVLAATLSLQALATGGKGMTWIRKAPHYAVQGVDLVGCDTAVCNPYLGDTLCTVSLPLLCLNNAYKSQCPAPAGLVIDYYRGWSGGHIATTPPVQGTALTSQAAADAICVAYFGTGWRMAEFHDGNGGWNWYAFGSVRTDMRYWVRINDQPANCWNP